MRTLLILSVLLFFGCATAPLTYNFDSTRTYEAMEGEVWSDLMAFFTTNNIQIRTIERDSGIVYAERLYAGGDSLSLFSQFADCGNYALEIPGPGSASFNVFVNDEISDQITVSVTTNFTMVWSSSSMWSTTTVVRACNSTGWLEGLVLNAINHPEIT